MLGAQWALSHSKDKKSVLSTKLEQIFSGETSAGLPAQVQEAARRWVPDFMAYTVVEGAGSDNDIMTSASKTVAENVVEGDPVDEDVTSPTSAEATPPEDNASEDFLKDHIQVIHVGDTSSDNADTSLTNGQDVLDDAIDETLPAFLQENG